ncbi:hypothetical protein [Phycicoccus sp. 3266]|jgi:hypothetical protein|nr:hypothetical protein [Phycicoccus sp. 3266]MDR6863056.1 hypothetical protein [Phycicoccus sp. 3266]
MAQQRSRHLRVVPAPQAPDVREDRDRSEYWAQVQALREQRRRLRAG